MNFAHLVEAVLQETTVIGGADSSMGPNVLNTASAVSGDNWNRNDSRIAKSLFGGVISRMGMKSSTKKSKKNNKRKKSKKTKK